MLTVGNTISREPGPKQEIIDCCRVTCIPSRLCHVSPFCGNGQVGYDNTVRDGEGCVHQFLYGEDGIDTVQTK